MAWKCKLFSGSSAARIQKNLQACSAFFLFLDRKKSPRNLRAEGDNVLAALGSCRQAGSPSRAPAQTAPSASPSCPHPGAPRDGSRGTLSSSPAHSARPAVLRAGSWVLGCRDGGAEAARARPLSGAGAEQSPGGELTSRRSSSGAASTSAKTQGIKGTLMGSKLSCAPWRIPGCLCSCQINSPVTAVMFNIPSHYLSGILGSCRDCSQAPAMSSPSPHPASWAAAALRQPSHHFWGHGRRQLETPCFYFHFPSWQVQLGSNTPPSHGQPAGTGPQQALAAPTGPAAPTALHRPCPTPARLSSTEPHTPK